MGRDIAEQLVENFERGLLSRRQLASRLMGLGATLAVIRDAQAGQGEGKEYLQGHRDRSRRPGRDQRAQVPRLLHEAPGPEGRHRRRRGQLLPRRRLRRPLLPDAVQGRYARPEPLLLQDRGLRRGEGGEKLKAAGLKPELVERRVYFLDPDGIKAQVD